MTILAVDHGTSYIGIALSDPDHIVARPLAVYPHTSREHDAARVAQAAEDGGASTILLGTPTNAVGATVHTATRLTRFVSVLKKHTSLPIRLWDESNSSIRAQQILAARHSRKKPQNISVHSIAAAVILQDYLDTHAA